eukprot:scaffold33407_cov112-Isochrysis_galbana.AAC.9
MLQVDNEHWQPLHEASQAKEARYRTRHHKTQVHAEPRSSTVAWRPQSHTKRANKRPADLPVDTGNRNRRAREPSPSRVGARPQLRPQAASAKPSVFSTEHEAAPQTAHSDGGAWETALALPALPDG